MTEATNKYQSIFGFGTTQFSRLPKALLPDEIQIEGKDLSQLMAYSAEYAEKLRFFNEGNVHEGNWESFLNSDISFILASIVSIDLGRINEDFSNQVEIVLNTHLFAEKSLALEGAFRFIHGLISRFNTWYQQIHAISLPNSELEYNVELELVSIIESQLRADLHKLKSYDLGATDPKALGEPVGLDYSIFEPIWYLDDVQAENIFIGDKPVDRVSRALISLRLLYRSVYNALSYARYNFQSFFEQSLQQKSNHKPDTGLLITFLQLYQYAQRDLNQVSINYLRFYYEHFLQLRPLESISDEVYLSMELAGHLDRHIIPAGEQLLAGQDEEGNDILFETTHELEINQAALESVRTVYLSKYNQPKLTSYEVMTGIYAATEANSRDGKGRAFENPHDSWPTFGEEQALKPQNADTMSNADIGFAIASPILRMKEGYRKVTMTLFFDPESIQIFKKMLYDIRQNLEEQTEDKKPISLEEAFYRRIFNLSSEARNIKIFLSGGRGWINVDPNTIQVSATGGGDWPDSYDKETMDIDFSVLQAFTIEFSLPNTKPAVKAFDPQVIKDGDYDTDFPIVKVLLADDVPPYLYTFLRDLKLDRVELEVEVQQVRQLQVYNDLGILDPKQPYQPFGPQPVVGNSFIFGDPELFSKDLTNLEMTIDWQNIPQTVEEFERHYRQYGKTYSPGNYKVQLGALSNYQFYPIGTDESLIFPLFKEKGELNSNLGQSTFSVSSEQLSNLQIQPNYSLSGANDFDTETETGYFKLELKEPEEAFGHEVYPKAFTEVVTRNAKDPEEEDEPLPNNPYTPVIRSVMLNYSATTALNLGSGSGDRPGGVYHVHPFGIVNISDSLGEEEYRLLPQYKEDGYLYLGLRNVKPYQTLSMFFQLTARNSHTGSDKAIPKVKWSYLTRNKWQNFTDRQLLLDTTDQFTKSGMVQLFTPRATPTNHTQVPDGLFWIRASVKGDVQMLCHCIDIKMQAMHVLWVKEGDDTRLAEPMPPGIIDRFLIRRPEITTVLQPFESFGGKPSEDTFAFFSRISERLRHKNRAITLWDYERLVLDQFHTIFQARAFSHLNYPEEVAKEDGVTLVVIPKRTKYLMDETPKANYKFLQKIQDYLQTLTSPFAKVHVRNPQYEYIRILAKVKFENNDGLSYQRLMDDLKRFIAPWIYDHTLPLNIGASMDENIILNYMKSLPYVRFVTKFSIVRIVELEDGNYEITDTALETGVFSLLQARPWGVFLPDSDHQIEMVEVEEDEEPEKVEFPIRFQNRVDIIDEYKKSIVIRPRTRKVPGDSKEEKGGNYTITIKL